MAKKITVAEISRVTGMSRATIYRRFKEGVTKEELLEQAQQQQATDEELDPEDRAAVTWCKAVLWAAENMNDKSMTISRAGSKLRYSMWESAQEYPKELLVQLVPKALAILDKNKQMDEGDEVEEAEKEGIQELEEMLKTAIEEALA